MCRTSPSLQLRWSGPANPAVSGHRRPRVQMATIFAIACWVSLATATSLDSPSQRRETLIIDTRIPVLDRGHWTMMSQEEHRQHLRRRVASGSADTETTTTIEIQVSTATATPTSIVVASPLPSPFDSVLASNFTGDDGNGACPAFINSMLTNSTFKQCYPFSMLMQGSTSFFQAEKSLVSITQVLDATCSANVTFCADYLNGVASNLTDSANCADDFAQDNSVVVQAYEGLRAYQPLYSAACLKNEDTSAYCFANAVTNSSAVSDVYLYFLPLNVSYPSTAAASCSLCTQQTMGIFQAATADRDQFVANTYANAATTVNNVCGSGFVNATLPAAESNAVASMQQAPSLLLLSLLVMAVSHWLL
ncbi:hypothetical protein BJ170DRAFT_594368 [Xylariales sp. AK1849]|nr:hypothetical protein BJ170DRAFT_594368 [Xylariales sp. AK1849]